MCGLEVRVTLRWIKGDLPASQRSGGIHSSGSARYRCIFCLTGSELFTNHVVCLACELRTPATRARIDRQNRHNAKQTQPSLSSRASKGVGGAHIATGEEAMTSTASLCVLAS